MNDRKILRAPRNLIQLGEFHVVVPRRLGEYMRAQLDKYMDTLLVKPALLPGKVVAEQNDVRGTGPERTIRWLFTADFDPKKRMSASVLGSSNPTPSGQQGYWESWMVVLAGSCMNDGFEVSNFEVYVHRQGGWDLVDSMRDSNPIHANGDVWPEAAGEPPANKGIVNTMGLDCYPDEISDKLQSIVQTMYANGADRIGDEVIVDMRNPAQRAAFWQFNAEIRKLVTR